MTNATQTVATHSDPAEEDQVGIISSDNRYTIADDSLQSAPDQEPTHQRQELSSSNQETKVHSKSNTNTQGSEKPKKTKPTQRRFLPNTPQRTAFVIGKINDCPTTLLIDSGACISVISYEFVKEVLHGDAHPEMTLSENLPTIGQIQVTLLLNGRKFPCQFHVITNMAYQAVLGRDFLQSNGAVINFSEGILKLDKTYPLKTTVEEEHSRALAILAVEETSPVARNNDTGKFLSKLPHYFRAFLHSCKKARQFFLKFEFLLILLLMSPHTHVHSQIKHESTTALHEGRKLVSDPEFTKSSFSPKHFESKALSRVQANHHLSLQFLLTPVRPKDSSIIFARFLKLPARVTAVYELQEERNIAHPDPIPVSRRNTR